MRTSSHTLSCPVCGAASTIALFVETDPHGDDDIEVIGLSCPDGHDKLSDQQLVELWTSEQASR